MTSFLLESHDASGSHLKPYSFFSTPGRESPVNSLFLPSVSSYVSLGIPLAVGKAFTAMSACNLGDATLALID